MSFKARMSVAFALLVAVLLGLFGMFLHARSEALREAEFFDRLQDRALLVEHLLEETRTMPVDEANHMTQALRDALPEEAITVLGVDGQVLFQRASNDIEIRDSWKTVASKQGVVRISHGRRQFVVIDTPAALRNGIRYTMASAVDERGLNSMAMLRRSMIIAGLLALLFTAGLAWVYAIWALVPVRGVVLRVSEIRQSSERLEVDTTRQPDELGSIAIAFNGLLARLDDAFQVQRTFIASASHELRTPLTVVRGELHHALAAASDGSEIKVHLQSIEEQVLHMQDLLNQLLWLARTHGPLENIAREMVRLDEVAERAMERCQARYPDRSVRFEMADDEEGHEPLVRGNAVLLTAAVYNLLTNAAKYGGEGPVTLLLKTTEKKEWSISVSDTGPGMPESVLARVRELFYRAEEVSLLEGHGIGLAMVDRIARVHRGRLDIVTAAGKGTTTTLVLPSVR